VLGKRTALDAELELNREREKLRLVDTGRKLALQQVEKVRQENQVLADQLRAMVNTAPTDHGQALASAAVVMLEQQKVNDRQGEEIAKLKEQLREKEMLLDGYRAKELKKASVAED
jgi:hypothetical protein